MLRRVVHQQVNVVVPAVHLHQLRFEIVADIGEDRTKTVDGISVKYSISVLRDEDQVNMKLKHTMSTASNLTMAKK